MATSFDDLLDALPNERRDRIMARARSLMDDESELQAALDAEEAFERLLFASRLAFTLFQDKSGRHRFRLVGSNGLVLLESPGFADKTAAERALKSFRRGVIEAEESEESAA